MTHRYYHVCSTNIGKAVEVRMTDGRIYRGMISRVTNSHVYLQTLGRTVSGNSQEKKGENAVQTTTSSIKEEGTAIVYPGYGYGYGYGYGGFGTGIALGAIATLAFLPFFFW